MAQKVVTVPHNIFQVFTELTMPQAVVIGTGMLAVSFTLQSALKHGWAPDFDFSNNRYRFVNQVATMPT